MGASSYQIDSSLRLFRSVCGHLQHQLAEVLAVEQLEQGLGEGLQTHHHVFLALHAAVFQVARHFGHGQVVTVGVVEHHDALHTRPVDQQAEVVFGALHSSRVVVLADGTADDDAGFAIDAGQHVVQNFAADVVKVNVYALGAVFLQASAHGTRPALARAFLAAGTGAFSISVGSSPWLM